MQITPLAAESMGARSMATFVETMDTRILIDPGVWLTEERMGLPPLAVEKWTVEKLRRRVQLYNESARVVIFTHFHPSQGETLSQPSDFEGRTLFIKNPNQKISPGRRKGAFEWISQVKAQTTALEFADGRVFNLGHTRLVFSTPVAENLDCGDAVIQVAVSEPQCTFVYSSEIAGAGMREAYDFMARQKPHILYLDGPITYKSEGPHGPGLEEKRAILMRILDEVAPRQLILDHHLLRDFSWQKKMEPLFKLAGERDIQIQTAAEYRGDPLHLLESRRKQLHDETDRHALPYEESL